jgi:hypothetical protein
VTRARWAIAAALLVAGAVSGCTASTPGGAATPSTPGTVTTVVGTHTTTATPSPQTFRPPAPSSRAPLRPNHTVHRGEKEESCPYIRSGLDEDNGTGVNLADIEGDRVYRTTVLTTLKPVGCRWYFYAPPYEATAELRPQTFATADAAYNAMVLTARTGTEPYTERNFAKGASGIGFKTRFFGPDKGNDWAFAFVKGRVLVVVYTQRTDTSRNAFYIAQAVVGRF